MRPHKETFSQNFFQYNNANLLPKACLKLDMQIHTQN